MDLVKKDSTFDQWTRAKSFDTFGIFGPCIVNDIDPMNLRVTSKLNSETVQDYNTSDMFFNVFEIVSHLSKDMTLYPGDIIACGTNSGLGPMNEGDIIENAKGNCHSLSLDLYDQWQAMEANKQWRFTPPTHVLAAFNQAIKEHEKEGGILGRYKRYSNNCKIICEGMKNLGFKQLLPEELQAPIIITFLQPKSSNFNFQKFYDALSQKDFLIYPGKLTVADTFRIGCIGNLNEKDMYNTISAIKEVLAELKIRITN